MSAAHPITLPTRPVLVGAGWRAAIVVAAAIAVALEAPAWARLPLSAAAVLGVATFFLRRYGRRGVLDVVLVVAGGGVVALALLGVLLNLLPSGLGPVSWGLAVGVLELGVLAFLAVFRAPAERNADATRLRIPVAGIAWGAAVAAVLAGTIVYSAVSFGATHVAPLALAAEPHGTSVTVTVTAGDATGPFDLQVLTADGRTTVARSIEMPAGGTYTKRIVAPATRAVVQLVRTGESTPLRQLVLDTGSAETR